MKRAIRSVCMDGCLITINKRERSVQNMFVKILKRSCSIFLMICLVFNLSVTTFARPEVAGVSYEEGADGSGYLSVPRFISEQSETSGSIFSEKKYFGSINRTSVLPSSYDSRSQINDAGVPYILPVRNQGSDGTCWAFSVCSAAETSMIKQNLFQEQNVLSPLQFTWFHYNRILNPLGLSGPDRVTTNKNILSVGGNEYLSVFALANWIGLVDESLAPYETAVAVSKAGLRNSLCYAKNSACLENAVWIGSENFDAVKEQIMENGSAILSFYMNALLYYNSSTYGYYCSEKKYDEANESFDSNHMVTIVGWDDNYKKENFRTTPQGDGAWLIKNSWGSNWGMGGYFWISYYDRSIYEEVNGQPVGTNVTSLKMTQPDTWDNNYSYDGGGGINWYYFEDDFTGDPIPMAIMANVYTAQYEERLSAVSFYTIQENIAYTVYVYKDVDTSISPTGGRFPTTVSGVLETAGYHTIELPEEIDLSPGMKYTVAVELNSQDENETVNFLADGSGVWDWVRFSSQIGKGESYYKEPGKNWVDVTEDTVGWCGNFRIHALTRLIYKEQGDVNANGQIEPKDALGILDIVAGNNAQFYWKQQVGDMNGDGMLTPLDALKILDIVAGSTE